MKVEEAKAKKTGLGRSPIPTAGPLLCGGRGRKSCWRQLLEPRLAGLGQACKAIFPPCRTRSWVMETSSCALELGLREGHSGSHRPGMGGQSVRHAISGLLSEMELDQSRLSGARTSFREWVLGRVRRFVTGTEKALASCKWVFLGKGKWGGVLDVSPQLSKLPGKPCMPEKEVEIPLVPKDRRNLRI